jgi:hypothetical protein
METLARKPKIQFNLKIEQSDLDWVKEYAKKHERPMNYIIAYAIKQLKKDQEI